MKAICAGSRLIDFFLRFFSVFFFFFSSFSWERRTSLDFTCILLFLLYLFLFFFFLVFGWLLYYYSYCCYYYNGGGPLCFPGGEREEKKVRAQGSAIRNGATALWEESYPLSFYCTFPSSVRKKKKSSFFFKFCVVNASLRCDFVVVVVVTCRRRRLRRTPERDFSFCRGVAFVLFAAGTKQKLSFRVLPKHLRLSSAQLLLLHVTLFFVVFLPPFLQWCVPLVFGFVFPSFWILHLLTLAIFSFMYPVALRTR